jgi:hypothetical protein
MTTVTTVVKNVIHRAWNDIEPKLLTFLATGLTASLLIFVANYVGWNISPALASVAVVVISTVAGYLKSSTTTSPFLPPTK